MHHTGLVSFIFGETVVLTYMSTPSTMVSRGIFAPSFWMRILFLPAGKMILIATLRQVRWLHYYQLNVAISSETSNSKPDWSTPRLVQPAQTRWHKPSVRAHLDRVRHAVGRARVGPEGLDLALSS